MKATVLFISGREIGYIRNRVLLSALQEHFNVVVYTSAVQGTITRIAAGLGRFFAASPTYDVCFVGFYGQPIAIALSTLQRKPIVLDAYISTYDTLCEERRRFSPNSLVGRLTRWLDYHSCQVATRVITDTRSHARYFNETFNVPENKLRTIYVGCDETLFYPRDELLSVNQQRVDVFYYGSFLPLHGTEIVVQAATLLRDRSDIHFTIGGDGMGFARVQKMISDMKLDNISLTGWLPLEQVPEYIARASICLGGHFSTVAKAARVISTKTFQFLAMRKPTIVGDNPATRELFTPGEHVVAVPMGNPIALAESIRILADDKALRHRIAYGGYTLFQQSLTTHAIADQLASIIYEVI